MCWDGHGDGGLGCKGMMPEWLRARFWVHTSGKDLRLKIMGAYEYGGTNCENGPKVKHIIILGHCQIAKRGQHFQSESVFPQRYQSLRSISVQKWVYSYSRPYI